MTCNDINELLVEYWDLSADDIRRKQLHDHIEHCTSCAEEFATWQHNMALIQHSSSQFNTTSESSISQNVMKRIYADEGWREPIPNRIYSISFKLRRKLTLVIAFFLALFMLGLLYSAVKEATPEPIYYSFDGLMPVASAVGDSGSLGVIKGVNIQGVPVASISDPFILGVNTLKTYPDYLVALSILGVICTLLIMNWFSRIRA